MDKLELLSIIFIVLGVTFLAGAVVLTRQWEVRKLKQDISGKSFTSSLELFESSIDDSRYSSLYLRETSVDTSRISLDVPPVSPPESPKEEVEINFEESLTDLLDLEELVTGYMTESVVLVREGYSWNE